MHECCLMFWSCTQYKYHTHLLFIDVQWFARSEFYLHLTTRNQEYNTANCMWFPFWKVSLRYYGKAYFLFFFCLRVIFSLTLSVCFVETHSKSVRFVRKHLCLNRSMCVPLRYIARGTHRLLLNWELSERTM